jgi:uncharacterized protein with von Willebrand factor type A (vWA) domain
MLDAAHQRAGLQAGGQLLPNLVHFGRLLRAAGLPVSADQLSTLAEALALIDIRRRADVYISARAVLVTDPHDYPLFDRAFDRVWQGLETWFVEFKGGRRLGPQTDDDPSRPTSGEPPLERHLGQPAPDQDGASLADDEISLSPTSSTVERLWHKDFAIYTDEEKEAVRRALGRLMWDMRARETRRLRRASRRARQLDLRASIRSNTRHGGEIVTLRWRRRKLKPRPLVLICDISGSMAPYSRLFLQFMHALSQNGRSVETFAFGTRLTRLTPALRHRDVDAAVAAASDLVVDWSGGTRIGESLKRFNYDWSRRVLGWGATVLIISDGWERGDMASLDREMARLRRSTRRLLWLNPLAGAVGYEPLVQGIQTALPYCDAFLPLHNLHSLELVVARLGEAGF